MEVQNKRVGDLYDMLTQYDIENIVKLLNKTLMRNTSPLKFVNLTEEQ